MLEKMNHLYGQKDKSSSAFVAEIQEKIDVDSMEKTYENFAAHALHMHITIAREFKLVCFSSFLFLHARAYITHTATYIYIHTQSTKWIGAGLVWLPTSLLV